MPPLDLSVSVARTVLEHPATAQVFRARRIDFCCRGDVSIRQACEALGLDVEEVARELDAAREERERELVVAATLGKAELIQHIVTRHHGFLRNVLPFVDQLAQKVARVHGAKEPKLVPLGAAVAELRATLEAHLDEEESSLFPRLLAQPEQPDPGALQAELARMRDEHLAVAALLSRIRTLAADFEPPPWACGSYRTLLAELDHVEADTFEHVHLENHVLAPAPPRDEPAPRRRSLMALGGTLPAGPAETPFDMLLACHGRIRHFTSLALSLAEREAPAAEVREVSSRLTLYFGTALPLHEEDEERTLGAALARAEDAAVAPLLEQLASEHRTIGRVLAELLPRWTELAEAPGLLEPHRAPMSKSARALATAFDAHLAMEERELFPLARRVLPTATQLEMLREMRERRRSVVGKLHGIDAGRPSPPM